MANKKNADLHLEAPVVEKLMLLLEHAGRILEESNDPRAWAADDMIGCARKVIEDHLPVR